MIYFGIYNSGLGEETEAFCREIRTHPSQGPPSKVSNASENGILKYSMEWVSSFSQEWKAGQFLCFALSVFTWSMCSFWAKWKNIVLVGYFYFIFRRLFSFNKIGIRAFGTHLLPSSADESGQWSLIATRQVETALHVMTSQALCVCVCLCVCMHVLVLSFLLQQLLESWGCCCVLHLLGGSQPGGCQSILV